MIFIEMNKFKWQNWDFIKFNKGSNSYKILLIKKKSFINEELVNILL